jgi:hypothetical protein
VSFISSGKPPTVSLATGKHPCVLIDDSGTPGQETGTPYLHVDRKSWVASEFHCTEIFAGKKNFKGIDVTVRLHLFEIIRRELFLRNNIQFLVQTISSETLAELRARGLFPEQCPDRLGPFNLKNQSDVALLLLLIQVKQFLGANTERFPTAPYAVIDEGFRKPDKKIQFEYFDAMFHGGCLYSVRSSEFISCCCS